MSSTITNFSKTFAADVERGLSATPKYLSSKYFYDAEGDKIFQQIMRMPEYYLTDCEYKIFNRQKEGILSAISGGEKFDLVELGAGDGYKTKVLIQYFLEKNVDFEYFPVDISKDVLDYLKEDLNREFPNLKVTPLNYEYFAALEKLNQLNGAPKVLLFLGSNIGNFDITAVEKFYNGLHQVMNHGDQILNGIDLKKDPRTIRRAYDDPSGITKRFNLNLLTRMNRELGANFNIDNFDHYASYDPLSGEARSYLMSMVKQEVKIDAIEKTFSFDHSEPIHTEISRKYSLGEIENLASKTNFRVKEHFLDSKEYFVDSLWIK